MIARVHIRPKIHSQKNQSVSGNEAMGNFLEVSQKSNINNFVLFPSPLQKWVQTPDISHQISDDTFPGLISALLGPTFALFWFFCVTAEHSSEEKASGWYGIKSWVRLKRYVQSLAFAQEPLWLGGGTREHQPSYCIANCFWILWISKHLAIYKVSRKKSLLGWGA